jgi:hypothetical protein
MRSRSFRWVPFAILACGAACGGSGGSSPPPATPAAETPPPPAATQEAPPPPARVPDACADASSPVCTPAGGFVDRLCVKPMQDVALALFAKKTPFSRLYLRGKVDELNFDEEVLALRFHGPQKGGMVIGSGQGSYDVLRWDGSCSTGVEAEMLATNRPPRPKSAHVQWHRIGAHLQDALIASSEPVKRAHAKRGKECQGAMSGDVSKSCEEADRMLVDAIVDYVRAGGDLPDPEVIP